MTAAPRVTVDVVSLERLERLAEAHGPTLDRLLLHPSEREGARGPDRLRRLGAALATKECWIKAQGRRPDGWTFASAAFRPCDASLAGDDVHRLIAAFSRDLDVTDVQLGTVHGELAEGQWAWHGIHERWLISAVLT
jgi:phosphopantetheinyl transferase (holo-ACP synthase)